MDGALVKEIGTKALLIGAGALLLFWTFNAIKLIIGARGINPLVKKFFNQIASGQIDGAYRLTTKTYRTHVNRQDFIKFLASLQLFWKNLHPYKHAIPEEQTSLLTNHRFSRKTKFFTKLQF